MLHIKSLEEGKALFKALGSDIRIEIIKALLAEPDMSMNELAGRLKITGGALTGHVKKLEECGILKVTGESGGHGNLKKCSVCLDKILIDLEEEKKPGNSYEVSLKVGHYSDCRVWPTCGMASARELIGALDDVRYFSHPERFKADILWFAKGYVEYEIPDLIPRGKRLDRITITAELGSEAPGVNASWPSDIHFYINGVLLGQWTSPGDFGDTRGLLTPDWWHPGLNQYGLLKMLTVNHRGTFIDGLQISDASIESLGLDHRNPIRFRLAVEEHSGHVGGLTIFGKGFGNYDQDIEVKADYSEEDGC